MAAVPSCCHEEGAPLEACTPTGGGRTAYQDLDRECCEVVYRSGTTSFSPAPGSGEPEPTSVLSLWAASPTRTEVCLGTGTPAPWLRLRGPPDRPLFVLHSSYLC